MELYFGKTLLELQDKNLKKLDNVRIKYNGYEYKLTYHSGFVCYIGIDRRLIGKRNFKYFCGFGAYNCVNVADALEQVKERIFLKSEKILDKIK